MGGTLGRSYGQRDIKLLFGKSGMYCAFPSCGQRLLEPETDADEEAVLANIAHIVAHADSGPRADPTFPKSDRDKYHNLVLLCAHHHLLVDAQDNEYTAGQVRGWKDAIEDWVDQRLTEGMIRLQFAELEAICRGLVNGTALPSSGLAAVPPLEKMEHNDLTEVISYRLTLGLMQAPQVSQYLQEMSTRIDPGFPERLRYGFVMEYERCWAEGLRGDAMFLALHAFAFEAACPVDADSRERFELQAAALAVLSHLFEVCDVFEAPASAAP